MILRLHCPMGFPLSQTGAPSEGGTFPQTLVGMSADGR